MPKFLRDKPKHTAYAFGELRGSQRREVETELADAEGSQEFLDDLIETADLLKHGFREEPELFLTAEQRKRVLTGVGSQGLRTGTQPIVLPEGGQELADAVFRRGSYAKGHKNRRFAAAAAVAVGAAGITGLAVVLDKNESRDIAGDSDGGATVANVEPVAVVLPDPIDRFVSPPPSEIVPVVGIEKSEHFDETGLLQAPPSEIESITMSAAPSYPALPLGYAAPVTLPLGGASSVERLAPIPSSGRPARLDGVDEASGGGLVSPYAMPLSTFPLSADPSVYANIRHFITSFNHLPPWELVSVADMVNYFPYDYESPTWDSKDPVEVTTEIGECPWAPERRLVRVAMKARPAAASGSPRNVVLLVDTSKGMLGARKLPMVEEAVDALLDGLPQGSLVSIVPFGGNYRYILRPTPGSDSTRVRAVLEALSSGVGDADTRLPLSKAVQDASRIFGNRPLDSAVVITDSVGPKQAGNERMQSFTDAIAPLRRRTREGVAVFGVGSEMLAFPQLMGDVVRNYRFFHCGSLAEAHRAFDSLAQGRVGRPVALGVRAEVEFNPETVRAYRLVGTAGGRPEDRYDLDREFELQPGQEVTAFYEIIQASPSSLVLASNSKRMLRYSDGDSRRSEVSAPKRRKEVRWDELMAMTVSYGPLGKQRPGKVDVVVHDEALPLRHTSESFRFGAAVAGFGMLIGGYDHRGDLNLNLVHELAASSIGDDPLGLRHEFIELIEVAGRLGR